VRPIAALAAAAFLAGCGGGSGGEGGTTSVRQGTVASQERQLELQNVEDNSLDTCSQYALKELAQIYKTKVDPEAVADAIAAAQLDAELKAAAKRGCLKALKP
jgi:hypothetical protein